MRSRVWVLLVMGLLISLFVSTLWELPANEVRPFIDRYTADITETGAVNTVTGILFDYRGFDTLGEATVIFAAAIILALFSPRRKTSMFGVELSVLVHYGVALVLPFLFVFGFYVIFFGHISPGGGFPGGALLTSTTIIYAVTYTRNEEKSFFLTPYQKKNVENFGMLLFLGLGLAGIGTSGYFLANMEFLIRMGVPGRFFSGGMTPLLNLASGLKVGAGLSIIFISLVKED